MESPSARVIELLLQSHALAAWFESRIDGVELKSDIKTRLAGSALDMALEHHASIVLLVDHRRYGSAHALARPCWESYVRGVWLHRCASDAEVSRFETHDIKNVSALVHRIEKLDGFQERFLSGVMDSSWKAMCAFTHSGFQQLVRRNTANTIEPNYDEHELLQLLTHSGAVALFSAVAIADLAGNQDLAEAVLLKARSAWGVESASTPETPSPL